MIRTGYYILAALAVPLLLGGCGSNTARPATGVTVTVLDPFPPQDVARDRHTFALTDAEVNAVVRLLDNLPSYEIVNLDIGVPRFSFELVYPNGGKLNGHFFRGPDRLVMESDDGLRVYARHDTTLHDYLVELIQKRGWKATGHEAVSQPIRAANTDGTALASSGVWARNHVAALSVYKVQLVIATRHAANSTSRDRAEIIGNSGRQK